jgi:hypothetical protein
MLCDQILYASFRPFIRIREGLRAMIASHPLFRPTRPTVRKPPKAEPPTPPLRTSTSSWLEPLSLNPLSALLRCVSLPLTEGVDLPSRAARLSKIIE